MIIVISMKLTRDAKRLHVLSKIDKVIAKKYSLDNLISTVKSEIRSALKNTKVHVAIAELKPSTGERVITNKKLTGGPFVMSLSNLLMQKKKPLVIGKDLQKFCKKQGIKTVRKSVKSIMVTPIQHRNQILGAIILENTKQTVKDIIESF